MRLDFVSHTQHNNKQFKLVLGISALQSLWLLYILCIYIITEILVLNCDFHSIYIATFMGFPFFMNSEVGQAMHYC